jgi:hypothetical protein
MSTSQPSLLFDPSKTDKISIGTLGYARARNRHRAYDLIVREFKKSSLSQSDLAKRIGRGTDVVCRLLSRPGNWELDTFSDLLFGICGSLAIFSSSRPMYRVTATTTTTQKQSFVQFSNSHGSQVIQSHPTIIRSTKEDEEPKAGTVQFVKKESIAGTDAFGDVAVYAAAA